MPRSYNTAGKTGAAKESERKRESAYDKTMHGSKEGLYPMRYEPTPAAAGGVPNRLSSKRSGAGGSADPHGKTGLPHMSYEPAPAVGNTPTKTMHDLADELHPVKKRKGY